MEFKLVLMTLTAMFFICSPPLAGAKCLKTPIIFNFGDSNSDTGGFAAAYGRVFKSPIGRAFFQDFSNRWCDGRLIIDFLCKSVNADYLSPFLEALTSNFENGANFAIAGSKTVSDYHLFILSTQVLQFKRFLTFSLKLHATGTKGMLGEVDFAEALYMIDIGQNDIAGAFTEKHLSVPHVIENITSFIHEIKTAISDIHSVGGRKFWVHNTGPLGCLPYMLARVGGNLSPDYDEIGCLRPLNEVSQVFNSKLRQLCEELRFQLKDSVIVYVDVYTIKYNMISNSALYGFEKPLMACCGGGGEPYNANISCGDSGHTVCEQGKRFISWDGVHYSDNANGVVVAGILSTNYSTPPLKFDYFCTS